MSGIRPAPTPAKRSRSSCDFGWDIRITKTKSGGTITTKVGTLHADGLGSVRAVTDANGLAVERTSYRPFGEEVAILQPLTLPETKGFIGERFDDASGLQYLNARYYDPKLAMFIQPDWWEVMQPGVGTNRYAYSFDDPINGKDPTGHVIETPWDAANVALGLTSAAHNVARETMLAQPSMWSGLGSMRQRQRHLACRAVFLLQYRLREH